MLRKTLVLAFAAMQLFAHVRCDMSFNPTGANSLLTTGGPPSSRPTCERIGLDGIYGTRWWIEGFTEAMLDPADPGVARMTLGENLSLKLVGSNVYNLNCERQLASVTWVSSNPEAVGIETSSRTAATLAGLEPGQSEVFADVVLIDGQSTRAQGRTWSGNSWKTIQFVRVTTASKP